jgi:hypothetical protein
MSVQQNMKTYKNQSIKDFLTNFDKGYYASFETRVQTEAGWYDWFCKDKSLMMKTDRLTRKLKTIINSPKINVNTQYVFFKNNCPANGPLYDDFRICDLETNEVIYTVTPKSGHTGKAEVYGRENEFQTPLAQGTWKDIVEYFNAIEKPSTPIKKLTEDILSTLEQQLEYLKHCEKEFGEVHDDEIESLKKLTKNYREQLNTLS